MMHPLLIHTRHFPPRGYNAITLFPFVFYNGDVLSDSTLRHETIHLYQQAALLVVPFYLLYLIFWLIGMVRYRNWDRAYCAIPFEHSAYRLESQKSLSAKTMAFDWLHMSRDNKNNP